MNKPSSPTPKPARKCGSLRIWFGTICLACSVGQLTLPVRADELEGRRFTVTAKPQFRQEALGQKGNLVWVSLDDSTQRRSLLWSLPAIRFVPVELDTNQTYTFDLLEKRKTSSTLPITTNLSYEFIRIEVDGKTLYDLETCEVHRTKMSRRLLPILYGLAPPISLSSVPTLAEERHLFPHRAKSRRSGCVVFDTSPRTYGAFVCEKCDAAFAQWLAAARAATPANTPPGEGNSAPSRSGHNKDNPFGATADRRGSAPK